MSEENIIEHLYSQIDRLISMQNTMLTVACTLFAIIIAVFAFFQWRINKKDQDVIIKTAKEELIENLIANYNLLNIKENSKSLTEMNEHFNLKLNDLKEETNILKVKNKELEIKLKEVDYTWRYFNLVQERILSKIVDKELLDNNARDSLLEMIRGFAEEEYDQLSRTRMAQNLFHLVMINSKEKIDGNYFISSIEKKITDL